MKKILILIISLVLVMLLLANCTLSDINLNNFEYNPKIKTQVFSSNNELIAEIYNENRSFVKIADMPEQLINGIIAVEDSRFYKHFGIDIIGIFRAFLTNLKKGEFAEGASTITQQLTRTIFLSQEKTLSRKIKEAILSIKMEKKYTKDQILEMYLNEIYLGEGTFGVQEASKRFFNKNVWELSLAECAMLAGLPQAPSAYAPSQNYELAKKRQEKVLNRMVDMEFITQEEADTANAEEIIIHQPENKAFIGKYKDGYGAYINKVVEEYKNYETNNLINEKNINYEDAIKIVEEKLRNGGFKIYTTMDTQMQERAISNLLKNLNKYGLQDKATGSVVTIDGSSGAVKTYYGGNTYIDMANEPRQPGSSIKPLYYAGAIEESIINGNTLVLDEITNFNGYTPKNGNDQYGGYITIREALVNSKNIPAVKVMNKLGVDKSISYIEKFGISTISDKDYNLATALGGLTYGVKPIEMASAYGVFTNSGVYNSPYFIDRVEDIEGNIIYKSNYREINTYQAIIPSTVVKINDILEDVINRGSGKKARLEYYSSGKTGTTNNTKDLWFAGYLGNYATAIWVGNVENKSVGGSSTYCAEIFGTYMKSLLDEDIIKKDHLRKVTTYDDTIEINILSPETIISSSGYVYEDEVISIIVPQDQLIYFEEMEVIEVIVDSQSDKLFNERRCPQANKEIRYYLKGMEPLEYCDDFHLLDKIEEFFKNNGKKKSNSNNNAA